MVRHQVHHAIDTLVRGHSGHTVLHNFLHRHRPDCLAIARKCMNDFTFGNETKNCVSTRHHESANILCAEPARRTLDAGFRSYCCDVGALPHQNAFDEHSLLPSRGLAAYLIDLRGSAGLAPHLGGHAMEAVLLYEEPSISYRREAVSKRRGPRNRSVVGKLVRDRFGSNSSTGPQQSQVRSALHSGLAATAPT